MPRRRLCRFAVQLRVGYCDQGRWAVPCGAAPGRAVRPAGSVPSAQPADSLSLRLSGKCPRGHRLLLPSQGVTLLCQLISAGPGLGCLVHTPGLVGLQTSPWADAGCRVPMTLRYGTAVLCCTRPSAKAFSSSVHVILPSIPPWVLELS